MPPERRMNGDYERYIRETHDAVITLQAQFTAHSNAFTEHLSENRKMSEAHAALEKHVATLEAGGCSALSSLRTAVGKWLGIGFTIMMILMTLLTLFLKVVGD